MHNQNEKRTKAIIFDVGNVILELDYSRSLEKLTKITEISPDRIRKIFEEERTPPLYETGKINTDEFLKHIVERLERRIKTGRLGQILQDIFARVLIENRFFERLKRRGYSLYVLSNTNEIHYDYTSVSFNFWKYFDKIFLSFQMGVMKPYREVFDRVLSDIPFEKKQVLFIDDDQRNIKAAKSFGIDSIRFTGRDALEEELKSRGVLGEERRRGWIL